MQLKGKVENVKPVYSSIALTLRQDAERQELYLLQKLRKRPPPAWGSHTEPAKPWDSAAAAPPIDAPHTIGVAAQACHESRRAIYSTAYSYSIVFAASSVNPVLHWRRPHIPPYYMPHFVSHCGRQLRGLKLSSWHSHQGSNSIVERKH